MNFDRIAEKCGLTPAKLALICVLGIVLVTVVYRNFIRDSSSGEAASAERSASDSSTAPAEAGVAEPAARAGRPAQPDASAPSPRKPWPEFNLAEAIARDPFAVPDQFPQSLAAAATAAQAAEESSAVPLSGEASDAERAAALAALQQRGVQLVMQNGREYVAKIGDRQVRVGEEIDGFRVIDISFHGVILEGDASP